MTTKAYELIETIRNALAPKYEFPYYALIRVHTRHYGTIHIPAPWFNGMSRRSKWAGNLPIASDKRDGEYYECPFCGEPSFFSGVCQDCRRDFEVWVHDPDGDFGNDGDWEDGHLPVEYQNHVALKKAAKEELLYRLDHGIPDLGIISAEVVLAIEPNNVCGEDQSPFMKESDGSAQLALDRVESKIRKFFELTEIPEIKKVLEDISYETDAPFDYIEGDVIEVEGSDELRRRVNGVWQHMHEGYDYWHPMARIHKESRVYPLREPSDEV